MNETITQLNWTQTHVMVFFFRISGGQTKKKWRQRQQQQQRKNHLSGVVHWKIYEDVLCVRAFFFFSILLLLSPSCVPAYSAKIYKLNWNERNKIERENESE